MTEQMHFIKFTLSTLYNVKLNIPIKFCNRIGFCKTGLFRLNLVVNNSQNDLVIITSEFNPKVLFPSERITILQLQLAKREILQIPFSWKSNDNANS